MWPFITNQSDLNVIGIELGDWQRILQLLFNKFILIELSNNINKLSSSIFVKKNSVKDELKFKIKITKDLTNTNLASNLISTELMTDVININIIMTIDSIKVRIFSKLCNRKKCIEISIGMND